MDWLVAEARPTTLILAGWAGSALLMAALWAWHLRLRNAAVVDVGWAASLALLAIGYAVVGGGDPTRRWLAGGLMGVWGLRLAVHLYVDRVRGGVAEDARYRELRESWHTHLGVRFFLFFQAQALLAALLSWPVAAAASDARPGLRGVEFAAFVLWTVSVIGETLADHQLARFKADPGNRGRVCRVGLWATSRHPNYFFEWLVWVAYALFASASPWGWLAWGCPALMLYLLFRVTGIPATEAHALRSRGDAYRDYQQTTSAFVPWWPRG